MMIVFLREVTYTGNFTMYFREWYDSDHGTNFDNSHHFSRTQRVFDLADVEQERTKTRKYRGNDLAAETDSGNVSHDG